MMEQKQTKQNQIKKEPLLRLVKRDALPAGKVVLICFFRLTKEEGRNKASSDLWAGRLQPVHKSE